MLIILSAWVFILDNFFSFRICWTYSLHIISTNSNVKVKEYLTWNRVLVNKETFSFIKGFYLEITFEIDFMD